MYKGARPGPKHIRTHTRHISSSLIFVIKGFEQQARASLVWHIDTRVQEHLCK
jgi:hypothetical protein